ncbi:HEAT repeat-containing protein 6 isoform X2 [Condylostylus longicornis]|nr:HEAT repeat-containing protein 6 isoform X2 [Condylostylus longicornis]
MGLLNSVDILKFNKSKHVNRFDEEILANVLACADSLLVFIADENINITDIDIEIITHLGCKVISIMYSNKIEIKDSSQCMSYLSSAINILQKIALEVPEWCEVNIGSLLGISKAFLQYGLIETSNIRLQKVLPSQQAVIEPQSIALGFKGGKILKTRKPRNIVKNKKQDTKAKEKKPKNLEEVYKNVTSENTEDFMLFNKTSDSDFSESDTGRIQNERHRQTKIRLNTISLIGAIAKNADKKVIFSYFHCLLPFEEEVSKEIHQISYSIFKCAVRDPNPKCRLAAFQVFCLLLYGSKQFLMQAENSDKGPSSFTPFSVALGNTIISMYEILMHGIRSENSLPVLTQVLKCLAILVQSTPFSRLKSGFVSECINHTRNLVYHKDPTIQVAALTVMEFFISTSEMTTEISESIGMPTPHIKILKNENKLNDMVVNEIIETEYYDEVDPLDIDGTESCPELQTSQNRDDCKLPWLLEKLISNLDMDFPDKLKRLNTIPASIPVRIECLQVLTALCSHILFLKDHLQLVSNALLISLKDEQNEVRLHSAKCLDALGHSINTFLLSNPSLNDVTLCQNFWISVLPPVIEKIQDPKQNSALKGTLCDFLSNVGVYIFEKFTHSQQMMLISLLTGISFNEDSAVRASAARALAVYVLYPSLRGDVCFVENTASSIVNLLKEKNSYVRIKSSWSLGNISDALIPLCNDSKLDRISDDLLQKMFQISIDLINYNDKVKCNIVRTIGNLLRIIRQEQIEVPSWRSLCFQSIEKLTFCLTKSANAKVKWNTCYALGNFMKNNILFTTYTDFNWQNMVFESICDVIVNSPNFKVRINGVNALTAINERNRYGSHFILIWSSLLAAIEQSDNLTDFNEYKHRDNLQEQLCFALSHMIKLAKNDDFNQLKINLNNIEIVKQIWKRVISRIIPENASPLINCSIYLKNTLKENNTSLSLEQKNNLKILIECFISPDEVF